MKKVAFILVVIALAVGLYFSIHRSITREARAALAADCPELVWLKREYCLSDQQYEKIVELHELHDVRCKELCQALSSRQTNLREVLKSETGNSPRVQEALREWREERTRSQDSIIQHMFEVSAEMDREQGERYRENVYQWLIVPGRTPHIDTHGEYNSQLIQHLKP